MKQIYHTIFMVYLFSYVQLSPASTQIDPIDDYLPSDYSYYDDFEDNYDYSIPSDSEDSEDFEDSDDLKDWKDNTIDKRSVEIPLSRSKRFFGLFVAFIAGIVSAAAANVISEQVNGAINRANGRSGGYSSKQQAIEQTINRNYNGAIKFRNRLARVNPQAARAIVISKNGFTCDKGFCRRYGAGQHSIGICSPQICHCSNGIPHKQTCGTGTVFDPLYKICNWPYNVKLCGA